MGQPMPMHVFKIAHKGAEGSVVFSINGTTQVRYIVSGNVSACESKLTLTSLVLCSSLCRTNRKPSCTSKPATPSRRWR